MHLFFLLPGEALYLDRESTALVWYRPALSPFYFLDSSHQRFDDFCSFLLLLPIAKESFCLSSLKDDFLSLPRLCKRDDCTEVLCNILNRKKDTFLHLGFCTPEMLLGLSKV